jgi:hypothetical protein
LKKVAVEKESCEQNLKVAVEKVEQGYYIPLQKDKKIQDAEVHISNLGVDKSNLQVDEKQKEDCSSSMQIHLDASDKMVPKGAEIMENKHENEIRENWSSTTNATNKEIIELNEERGHGLEVEITSLKEKTLSDNGRMVSSFNLLPTKRKKNSNEKFIPNKRQKNTHSPNLSHAVIDINYFFNVAPTAKEVERRSLEEKFSRLHSEFNLINIRKRKNLTNNEHFLPNKRSHEEDDFLPNKRQKHSHEEDDLPEKIVIKVEETPSIHNIIMNDCYKKLKFKIQHRSLSFIEIDEQSACPQWWPFQTHPREVPHSSRIVGVCHLYILRCRLGRYHLNLRFKSRYDVDVPGVPKINFSFGMEVFHWFCCDIKVERVKKNRDWMISITHVPSNLIINLINFHFLELEKIEERLVLGNRLDGKAKELGYNENYLIMNGFKESIPLSLEEKAGRMSLKKFYWTEQ